MRLAEAIRAEETDGLPPRERRAAVLTVSIAITISVLSTAIANIALPTIARELHVTPSASIWVVNAYQLAVTVTLLPLSALGDIAGYRRVYLCGLGVFTVASLACGLSDTLPMLVAARVLQGFGAAGIMSVNTALVRFIFPRSQLGRGMATTALVVATSSAAGPSLAAAILSVASWHWLFRFNVPLGVLAIWLALRSLPETPTSGHRFDLVSALLNAATFGLLLVGLDGIGQGQDGASVTAELLAGTVAAVDIRPTTAADGRTDAPGRPLSHAAVRAVGPHVGLFVRGADQCLPRVALLLRTGGRNVAVADRLLITPWPAAVVFVSPVAGRLSDRVPGWTAGRSWPCRPDRGPAVTAVTAATAAVRRRDLADDGVRPRLRFFPVAEQPSADRRRPAPAAALPAACSRPRG